MEVRAQLSTAIKWKNCYGGSLDENGSFTASLPGQNILPTQEGGLIVVGQTSSIDGDINIKHRYIDAFQTNRYLNPDIWVIKLSNNGEIEWSKIYGGNGTDNVSRTIRTSDGGILLCGSTSSFDGDFPFDTTGNMQIVVKGGIIDGYVLKLDSAANKEWAVRIGGTEHDIINDVVELSNGDFVAVGTTYSNDEYWLNLPWMKHSGPAPDAFITYINNKGQPLWNRLYGGTDADSFDGVVITTDGSIVACGTTRSDDGDISKIHYQDTVNNIGPTNDVWVVKLSVEGEILSENTYGGSAGDLGLSILKLDSGNILISAVTLSTNGNVIGYHPGRIDVSFQTYDFWVFKIDSLFNIIWQNCIGGSGKDQVHSLTLTQHNTYLFCGYTNSSDSDLTGIHKPENAWDIWIGELSADGKLLWQKCLGGTGNDYGNSIIETDDGFMVYGSVGSNDGDIVGNHGGSPQHNRDIWVAKLKINQNAVEASSESHFANPYPNPSGDEVSLRIHPTIAPQSVKFYNLLGQEFTLNYTLDGNLLTANITSLPKGMYVIRITYPGITFQETRKFVKGK